MTEFDLPPEQQRGLDAIGADSRPVTPGELHDIANAAIIQDRMRSAGWETVRQRLAAVPGVEELVDAVQNRYDPNSFIEKLEVHEGMEPTPLTAWANGTGDPAAAAKYITDVLAFENIDKN